MTYLAARFLPPVGRRAWRLLAGVLLFEVGTGMTLPLVIVYLHDARGLGLGDAGVALAAVGAGGIVATIAAGVLVDRMAPVLRSPPRRLRGRGSRRRGWVRRRR